MAIVKAFSAGRGYQCNRKLCESEAVLREWLLSDGVGLRRGGLTGRIDAVGDRDSPRLNLPSAAGLRTASELSDHFQTVASTGNAVEGHSPHGFDDVRASRH